MIDQTTIATILDRAEIYDVVSDFVTLHRRGANYVGLCPFHEDKRPSFYVSPSKNICKCFACGEGGTPLNFLIKHENISYVEALRYLAAKYGIPITERELSAEEMERKNERESLLAANRFAKDTFAQCLRESGEGRLVGLSYFREREFTQESIDKFELGYSPADHTFLSKEAQRAGIDLKWLEKLGLLVGGKGGESTYTDRFRERVIFPIHSISGNVVGFGGRIMRQADKLAKYINSPESELYNKSRELYGIYFAKHAISKKDKCLIVEGYTDVISLHQAGIENVVASSGTALTTEQCRLIKRFTNHATLVFDADAAGIKATRRGINLLLEQDMDVRIVLLPPDHDPDSFAKTHSREAILEYLESHEEDFVRFKIRLSEVQTLTTPSERVAVVSDIVETISYIEDDIKREVYVQDSAELLGMSLEASINAVDSLRKKRKENDQRTRDRQATTPTRLPLPAGVQREEEPLVRSAKEITKFEHALLYYLVRFGNRELKEVDPETGAEDSIRLLDLLSIEIQDLREQKVLSHSFETVLDECSERVKNDPEYDIGKYLLSHPHDEIRQVANEGLIATSPLSRLHDKYQEESKQTEQIFRGMMTDILSLKYFVVERQITKLLAQLKQISNSSENLSQILSYTEQIQKLTHLKSMMSERLGDRILTPRNLLL